MHYNKKNPCNLHAFWRGSNSIALSNFAIEPRTSPLTITKHSKLHRPKILINQKYIIFQITETLNSAVKLQVRLKIKQVHRIIFHSIYIAFIKWSISVFIIKSSHIATSNIIIPHCVSDIVSKLAHRSLRCTWHF